MCTECLYISVIEVIRKFTQNCCHFIFIGCVTENLSLLAVEAVLRGDEATPTRLDSISVSEIPPPVPNTPRPRPTIPQPLHNEDSARPLPAKPSHSHFHRALPAPPPISRTKDMEGRSISPNSGMLARVSETSPPLPPNRPGSPHTGNTANHHVAFSKPHPPRRPQIPIKPNHTSPPPTPSDRPAPPRRPKPPLPRRPSNLSTSPPPPLPPNKPRSVVPRQDSTSSVTYNVDLAPSGTAQDMIANLQQSAPDILAAMHNRYSGVPQFLEALADLTESIVNTAQSTPSTKSIAFRKVVASLRGGFGYLRDVKGPLWQRNEEKVTKCVNDIVSQVSQMSSHLG